MGDATSSLHTHPCSGRRLETGLLIQLHCTAINSFCSPDAGGLTKRSCYPSDQGVWVRVSVMVGFIPIAVGATIGLGVATVGVPGALGAVGFTGAGIAAGTPAAKMMSAAAIANGGGVAAGSTVAVLQSVGAAGLSLATKGAVTAVGGALSFFYPK
ncbi:interferon alpha-inducible protein 27-like protein 2A isoform X2 [Trachemys scripta elegans]|uniref:interferon alpha-inducible protein 27-like protein 2A isoform X2 n=1 Tax=Trachemys scripta elegans TaxID=31138 RepID=UPI0015569B4C|nr:interferon alpha-inducible protein 27-like protein 2A isoform X2 [Trachemys scripta elegans]